MNHTKYIATLAVASITLALTIGPWAFADQGMGYMMGGDDQQEMMPWAGRYGRQHMPYMDDRRGQGMGMGMGMGMGNMMGMMPMLMHGLNDLKLSKQQRLEIRSLLRDLRKKNWKIMETNMELSDKLADLYAERPRNASNIAAVYDKIFSQKKQMIIDMVEVRNKVDALLTEEQRKELDSNQQQGMGYGMGYGMGSGMMH
jgi:Spy/CpxP family protein refolding chaperone